MPLRSWHMDLERLRLQARRAARRPEGAVDRAVRDRLRRLGATGRDVRRASPAR